MSKCKHCNVIIHDKTNRCPLCNRVVEMSEDQYDMYPNVWANNKKYRFLENWVLFLSLVAGSMGLVVDAHYTEYVDSSILLVLGLIYTNVVLRLAILGKSGYLFKTISLTVMAGIVLYLADLVTGNRGWALNFVVPSTVLALDATVGILMIVNRRNWQSYMTTQIFTLLVSLILMLLLALNVISSKVMPNIAFAVSLFFFLGTLILGDVRARDELYRRFHF